MSRKKKQLVWHIRNWERLYDVTPTKESARYAMAYVRDWVDPRGGLTTRKEIDGLRQAIIAAGGYELYGIYVTLRGMAADQMYAQRGWLLNHLGQPASLAQIAAMLQLSEPCTASALRKLSGASVMAAEAMEWEQAQCLIEQRQAVIRDILTQDNAKTGDSSGGSERPPGNPSSPETQSRHAQPPTGPPRGEGGDGERSSTFPAEKEDQDKDQDQDQDLRLKSAVLANREDAGAARPRKEREEDAHAMNTEREPDPEAEFAAVGQSPPPRDETERSKRFFSSPPVHPVIDKKTGGLAARDEAEKSSKGASKKGLNDDFPAESDPWKALSVLMEKLRYRIVVTRELCLDDPSGKHYGAASLIYQEKSVYYLPNSRGYSSEIKNFNLHFIR